MDDIGHAVSGEPSWIFAFVALTRPGTEAAQTAGFLARMVYVDIDPDALSESLQLLDGNQYAAAVRANVREPRAVLDHPQIRKLLDFDQPTAVLLVAVLHFVEDTDEAGDIVTTFRSALAPGSHVVVAHASFDLLIFDRRLWEMTLW
jgi:hypothetical protein